MILVNVYTKYIGANNTAIYVLLIFNHSGSFTDSFHAIYPDIYNIPNTIHTKITIDIHNNIFFKVIFELEIGKRIGLFLLTELTFTASVSLLL